MADDALPFLRATLAAAEGGDASAEARAVLDSPAFQRAAAALEADHDNFVAQLISLTQIPSPPFGEAVRAAAFAEMLRAQGLQEVETDAEGNVTAYRPGTDSEAGVIVLCSHLDTVFPAGTDVTVRREGTILRAPGVGDDTRGLALLLALARALDAAEIRTRAGLLFLGSVGEEGAGDLRGVKAFFEKSRWRGRVAGFVALDGLETARMVHAAVGSKRYRATFRGPGGHSYGAFGLVNPAFALARAMDDLGRIRVPARPKTTFSIGRVGGGSSINAIPEEMWMEVDLRSESPEVLAALEARFLAVLPQAAADENAARDTREGEIRVEVKKIGDRPAGSTPVEARITRLAGAVITAQGYALRLAASSTDSNIPMSLGIPAVTVGTGGSGDRAHSLEEWIDVEPVASVKGMATALGVALALSGISSN
ncbi:M20/M25/M40 family metallo-hydrolase [Roseomonas sp. GC11]|uniref:M20/M25/M40 family metallo-hydrolase n=1 Tax=Roseomonas sp. GC11 TaxID=2950546 RepID=UPI00210BBD3D|nr:M20/M25/M40 family metallo-hydrolase [Roseomonas sp. GC11]MCQ4162401.1 M20/M25/M40 family metallo-hydrolase [Roseomonas sp. GC11]